MTTPLRYDDWTIARTHRDVLQDVLPASLRRLQLLRQIPGLVNGRLTEGFTAGMYIMPTGSEVVLTMSDRHDVSRTSLFVFAEPVTTVQSNAVPPAMTVMEAVRTLFSGKRATGLNGELYSTHSPANYERDDHLARRFDLLMLNLTSTFREDR